MISATSDALALVAVGGWANIVPAEDFTASITRPNGEALAASALAYDAAPDSRARTRAL